MKTAGQKKKIFGKRRPKLFLDNVLGKWEPNTELFNITASVYKQQKKCINIVSTVKHGGGYIILWGFLAASRSR